MLAMPICGLKKLPLALSRLLLPPLLLIQGLLYSHAAAAARPNIVFVMMDDMEVSPVGYMNSTKTLIRNQGTEFERAYFAVPLCAPSRASILTGKYPQNTHVFTNRGHIDFYANGV